MLCIFQLNLAGFLGFAAINMLQNNPLTGCAMQIAGKPCGFL